MQKKHVLIIGKSPAALSSMKALLQERGYEVDTTDNFDDITTRFNLAGIDLITTGGQVPPEKRSEIRQEATEINPNMLFVQGLSGIAGLVARQIIGELTAEARDPKHAPTYDAAARAIKLSLAKPAEVEVIAWWATTFVPPNPGSDSRVLLGEQLPAGERTLSVPADIPETASFATVQIDDAIYAFGLTASA